MPKTIFVTVSRGSIARNLLHTDFPAACGQKGVQVIILSPASADQDFQQTFAASNVIFEPLLPHQWKRLDYFFSGLCKGLVYNKTRELIDRYGLYGIEIKKGDRPSWLRYAVKKAVFWPLSRLRFIRGLVVKLDSLLLKPKGYKDVFEKYQPLAVLSTNPFDDSDIDVLKAAKSRGVATAVLIKSWDNLSKMSFRVEPDRLLLWGPGLVTEAKELHGIAEEKICVVGVPQFDIYRQQDLRQSREEFFRKIGADPEKALVVFGSEGKISPADGEVAEIIYEIIRSGCLPKPAVLYLRPYFAFAGEESKFAALEGKPDVIIDRWFKPAPLFRDRWDYSLEHARHFANLIYHADVMVCTASTLTLDAVVGDKPVVNIAFDGKAELPYAQSVRRWYDTTYNKRIVEAGASWLVKNKDELEAALIECLLNPGAKAVGRARLRREYCPEVPGGSGRAVAEAVISLVEDNL